MKHTVKHWKFWMGLGFLKLCIACEPDSLSEDLSKSGDSAIVKKLTREELRQRFSVMEKLEEMDIGFRISKAKTNDGFTIETEEIIYIEKGNRHSYTFLITTDESDSKPENLVLNYEEGAYTAYRVTYDFTPEQLANPVNLDLDPIQVKVRVLEDFDLSAIYRKKPEPCVTWEYKAAGWNEQGQVTHRELLRVVDQDCLDQLNSGGQTSSSTTSGGVRPGGWGGWMGTGLNTGVYGPPTAADNSGYTGGSSGGHPSVGTPVFTRPVFPKMKFANYIKSLKESLKTVVPNSFWWRSTSAKKIVQYLEEHFNNQTGLIDIKASEFAVWAVQYLTSHPEVTWEQFENWFLTPIEGGDGEYDSEFWDNPNLTFQKQELPGFYDFNNAYPRMKGESLIQLIGGEVLELYTKYSKRIRGYCALKVSRALNYSGVIIPHIISTKDSSGTVLGTDGKYYFLNAKALNKWMQKTFGVSPDNSYHIRISGNEGGIKGENFPRLTAGIKGIYSMVALDNIEKSWASGHADLINDGKCVFGCSFYDERSQIMPVQYIDIWILN